MKRAQRSSRRLAPGFGMPVFILIALTGLAVAKPLAQHLFNPAEFQSRSPVLNSDDVSGARLKDFWRPSSSFFSTSSSINGIEPVPPLDPDSKMVFSSNRDGSYQIYVMNSDGSGVVRLTSSGANDEFPRWSPNGTKILFQSDRDNPTTGYMDIYVMGADGSGVTRLTSDPNDDSMASWSPDGSQIVFQSMRSGTNYQLYAMSADGSNQINITNTSSNDGEPSWSPDGTKIAFASDRDHEGYYSIYLLSADGNQQRLTFSSDTIGDSQPTWSPDGSKSHLLVREIARPSHGQKLMTTAR